MENYPFLSTVVEFYNPYYGLHHMSKIIPVVHYVFIERLFKVQDNTVVRESLMK